MWWAADTPSHLAVTKTIWTIMLASYLQKALYRTMWHRLYWKTYIFSAKRTKLWNCFEYLWKFLWLCVWREDHLHRLLTLRHYLDEYSKAQSYFLLTRKFGLYLTHAYAKVWTDLAASHCATIVHPNMIALFRLGDESSLKFAKYLWITSNTVDIT